MNCDECMEPLLYRSPRIVWGWDGDDFLAFCDDECCESRLSDGDGYEYCEDCGERCQGEVMDFGVGYTEFWGAPGYDSQPLYVSTCCEQQVYDNPALKGPALSY